MSSRSSRINERTESQQPTFSYLEDQVSAASDFKNADTANWIIVIGLNFAAVVSNLSSGTSQFVEVLNSGGKVIDTVQATQNAAGSPTSFANITWTGLFKKLLVPPGGSLHTNITGPLFFQALKGKFSEILQFL